MFRIVIKHGILVPMAIISTLVSTIIVVGISQFLGEDYNSLGGAVLSFDCVISSLCIYLLFGFNDNIYAKLCWNLHHFCEKRKLNKIETEIKSAVRRSTISYQTDSVN